MWKCKKCGSEDIFRPVGGKFTGVEKDFDKNGMSMNTDELELDTMWSGNFECPDCMEEAKTLEELAYYVGK